MSTHNIGFYKELTKIIFQLSSNTHPISSSVLVFFFSFFFLIQFNVPFKIISLIETSQSIGGRNGRTPGKPPDTPASRMF